eukprot:7764200-Pyramimonas_sp.AAC.1
MPRARLGYPWGGGLAAPEQDGPVIRDPKGSRLKKFGNEGSGFRMGVCACISTSLVRATSSHS